MLSNDQGAGSTKKKKKKKKDRGPENKGENTRHKINLRVAARAKLEIMFMGAQCGILKLVCS